MAKLNGVSTLDMTNGEITKIAYEGEEYTKVVAERKGIKSGDIIRVKEARGGRYRRRLLRSYYARKDYD